ncbi:primosomal protein N' [Candidatus Falkowbacteria bacterium]|nr:primosomal protein N' [Candidatus Falkowbacteria bacterium]
MSNIVRIVPLRRMPRGMDYLDYLAPDAARLSIGNVIEVPFRGKAILGLVIDFPKTSDIAANKFKIISSDAKILLTIPCQQIELAKKISEHYYYSLPGILKMMVPDIPKKKFSDNVDIPLAKTGSRPITNIPANIKKLVEQMFCSSDKKYLLFDYDNELKSQFFVETATRIAAEDKQCLLLFPNIAAMEKFLQCLPKKMADKTIVITSKALIAKNQHNAIWQGIFDGKYKIIIGTRSALFFTFNNLAAILVDSSHSVDYKNYDQNPRFHGITVTKWLSAQHNAILLLASCAPRIVDYFEAKNEKWKQIILGTIDWQPRIISTQDIYSAAASKHLSFELLEALEQALGAKQRSLLIVNRKGAATSLFCSDCGFVAACPTCKLPMSIMDKNLQCFRCGHKQDVLLSCPKCQGSNLKQRGIGIEQIAKAINKLYPAARVSIVCENKDENLNADIVIATAEILNKPNWPQFSLLGIVYADSALYLADYFASSRLYEFLNELVVNARFASHAPKVIVQTRFIDNLAIKSFGLPYSTFFEQEIDFRKNFKYPPFVELIKFICQGDDEAKVAKEADRIYKKLASLGLDVLAPFPFYAKKVRKKYQWQILLKSAVGGKNKDLSNDIIALFGADWRIDKDPVSLL